MKKTLISRNFADALDTYDANAVVQRTVAEEMVGLMRIAGFPDGATIYEVGAGTGLLTRMIFREFSPSRIVANDLCLEACPRLKAISDRVEFLPGDAERLPVPAGCAHVASCSAIQWFSDIGGFFSNMAAGLGRGGYLAFSAFGPENLVEIRELAGAGLDYLALKAYVVLLECAGFEVLHSVERREATWHRSVADLLRHIRGTGTGGVASEKWSAARTRRFCVEYAERFPQDGGVSLTYHPMYFVARKV